MTNAGSFSDDTLDELRAWVGVQLEDAVAASEVPDGWVYLLQHDLLWPADKELLLSGVSPSSCGPDGEGRIDLTLLNGGVSDPFVVSDRVRAFWESEGWTVTDILAPPSPTEDYFRADRDDGDNGMGLGFTAKEGGLVLSVYSRCSQDTTVVDWLSEYRNDNAFKDELERREQAEQ